ncbi:hypothetical protein Ocin01_16230 [Orchesella cincta]|uniref:Uncharacterized protein n=1 Tax=Orchesella cincta TaxID=48709 RepID=A0A1D2MC06_ORCCI|nr:hypothetical protein Ocin01_16230 [Orchesella cincta]
MNYSGDLNLGDFVREVPMLRSVVEHHLSKEGKVLSETTAMDILNVITKNGLAGPLINCQTALGIFLTCPCTMGQERLNSLAILSIEHTHAKELSFDEVIEKFIAVKCRKVKI